MHINILETSCVYRLLCWIAPRFPTARRLLCLCDSNVARCAIHKGRSSSRSLLRALRRIAAVQVAFGLYVHLPYCPTRLMPADHPSRGAEIPEPGPPFVSTSCSRRAFRDLAVLPRLRRWAAAWLRMLILLSGFRPCGGGPHRGSSWTFRGAYTPSPLDFDSTLGFPGEGPLPHGFLPPCFLCRGLLSSFRSVRGQLFVGKDVRLISNLC